MYALHFLPILRERILIPVCRLDEPLMVIALVFCHASLSLQQFDFHSYDVIATGLLIVFISLLIFKHDDKTILFCYCMLVVFILTSSCLNIEYNHRWQR